MNFDFQLACEMAAFSRYAYGQTPFPLGYPQYDCLPIDNDVTDIHAVLVKLPDRNILAFRGTDSIKDFLEDAQIEQVPFRFGKAHKGFLEAYCSIADRIRQVLLAARLKPLYGCAHSLGATLIKHAALDLSTSATNFQFVAIYTFGEPRWTNRAGAAGYDRLLLDKTWRVVNRDDGVPKVPWCMGRYRHTKNLALLDSFGKLDINPGWRKHVLSDLYGFWYDLSRRRKWSDLYEHGIDRYIVDLGAVKA